MKYLFFGGPLLLTLLADPATAQNTPPSAPRVVTRYFTVEGDTLPSAAGASYRTETTYRDSISGTVRLFYPSGALQEATQYAYIKRYIKHGLTTRWYENGKMQAKESYMANHLVERLSYFPDGTLRRREQYQDDKLVKGECFGPYGQPVAFFDYETMPQPPGGMEGLMRHLAQNLRYPASALQSQVMGKVFINFEVGVDGQVQYARVFKGLHPALDAEALRVIRLSPKWKPGQRDGEAVRVRYAVPVTFTIR